MLCGLAAQSKIFKCVQYNGYYGCSICVCKGTAVVRKLCGHLKNHRIIALMLQYLTVLIINKPLVPSFDLVCGIVILLMICTIYISRTC